MKFRSLLSVLLVLTLIASLTLVGCSKKNQSSQKNDKANEKESAIEHIADVDTPEKMPEAELCDALEMLEFSMLSAALGYDEIINPVRTRHPNKAYVGDLDHDGDKELVFGDGYTNVLLQKNSEMEMHSFFAQAGTMFTDKDGVLWNTSVLGGPIDAKTRGTSQKFYKWTGNEWAMTIEKNSVSVYEANVESVLEVEYLLNESPMTEADFNGYGFQEYTTLSSEIRTLKFDSKYKQTLVMDLYEHLEESYNVFSFYADLNDDGKSETIIVANDVLAKWYDYFDKSYQKDSVYNYLVDYDFINPKSAIFVVSSDDKNVTFTTYGYNGTISALGEKYFCKHYLQIGDSHIYMPNCFESFDTISEEEKTDVLSGLEGGLKGIGYINIILKVVDIAETEGTEVICLAQKDGEWYLLVIRFENGLPVIIYTNPMTSMNSASYIISYNGQICLLDYSQNIYSDSYTGNIRYSYSYKVYRFKADDRVEILFDSSLNYSSEDKNASEAAAFFDKLNEYLSFNIIVIYDPYVLTGVQWIKDSEIDLGEPPEQTIDTEEGIEEQTRIGFVEVDSDSWLNFRVGAGINHAKVLVDPSNPESFIKLAKGTPVTILEEININDAENPLWYKIQVNYGDRTLVGYSSATYIRTEN